MDNDVDFGNRVNIENPVSASAELDLNRPETAVGIAVLIVAIMLTIFSISYALNESRLDKPNHRLAMQSTLKNSSHVDMLIGSASVGVSKRDNDVFSLVDSSRM
jgi:hypothetical protein